MFIFKFLKNIFFGRDFIQEVLDTNVINIYADVRSEVDLKYLKNDIKKLIKFKKRYDIKKFLDKRLISFLDIKQYNHYEVLPDKVTRKELKFWCTKQELALSFTAANVPASEIQRLNSNLNCLEIESQHQYPIRNAYRDVSEKVELLEELILPPCESDFGWKTCEHNYVDPKDGSCIGCGETRVKGKELKTMRKVANEAISKIKVA